ncbi:MAG: hypothetical protein WDA60_16485 [Acidimicrobiia bacterium]|jgi:hypothetical protein
MSTCRHCGSHEKVSQGLCERCHGLPELRDEATRRPASPDVEPAHDRPWVARSAFTARTRRNPRT